MPVSWLSLLALQELSVKSCASRYACFQASSLVSNEDRRDRSTCCRLPLDCSRSLCSSARCLVLTKLCLPASGLLDSSCSFVGKSTSRVATPRSARPSLHAPRVPALDACLFRSAKGQTNMQTTDHARLQAAFGQTLIALESDPAIQETVSLLRSFVCLAANNQQDSTT